MLRVMNYFWLELNNVKEYGCEVIEKALKVRALDDINCPGIINNSAVANSAVCDVSQNPFLR